MIGEYYEISSAEAILRSGLAPCSSARLARWAQRMRCPACFHDNPMGVSTCVSCGQPLGESAQGARPGTAFEGVPGTAGGPVSEYGGTIEMPGPGLPAQGAVPMMRFENYAILQKEDGAAWELGRGAMGITYKAQDTDLHVPVALIFRLARRVNVHHKILNAAVSSE